MSTQAQLKVVSQNDSPLELKTLLSDEIARVDAFAYETLSHALPLIPEMTKHLMKAGGKRLRPLLTLSFAKMLGYEGDRHVKLAAAVEFIHTATLLHDDVIDASALRRGLQTAHMVWGNKAAVLVGDFLLARSFEIMVDDGDLRVLKNLSKASGIIVEGELHQLMNAHNLEAKEEDYLHVISSKTARLFETAAEVGAIVAGADEKIVESAAHFGRDFGIAFQLVDDALDYCASAQTLGKNIGDDMREGKVTLPVLHAYEKADEGRKAMMRRIFVDKDFKEGDFENLMDLMQKMKSIDYAFEKANFFANKALSRLENFEESALKATLTQTLTFCVNRNF